MQAARRPRKDFAVATRGLAALVATCAAWLVSISHAAAVLHFALISHQICADHGEVVHAEAAAHATPTHASEPTAQATSDHAGHDHCPLLGRRLDHQALLDAPQATLDAPPVSAGVLPPTAIAATPSRAELLLAAPKQSPPV
jgi:hypothetical protein